MIKDIQIDTEALVVDAYPLMHEQHQPAEMLDIAWGFYGAMMKQYPELIGEFQNRMQEMVKAVQDIQLSSRGEYYAKPWFTQEELEEVPNTHGKMFYIHKGE